MLWQFQRFSGIIENSLHIRVSVCHRYLSMALAICVTSMCQELECCIKCDFYYRLDTNTVTKTVLHLKCYSPVHFNWLGSTEEGVCHLHFSICEHFCLVQRNSLLWNNCLQSKFVAFVVNIYLNTWWHNERAKWPDLVRVCLLTRGMSTIVNTIEAVLNWYREIVKKLEKNEKYQFILF